jgi:outer membrane lipoprotein carrier protein
MARVKFWFPVGIERRQGWRSLLLCLGALLLPLGAIGGEPAGTAQAEPQEPAGSAGAELSLRLQRMDDYAARFTQAIAGSRGEILEQSTGLVLLDRPRFKWVVDHPYPQVIVTEGDLLKVYDPDLEQLTIRPLEEALKDTPISLLTRPELDLSADFLITRLPEGDTEGYLVAPRGSDSLFAEIRMIFDDTGLASLGILDHLGQYTEILFEVDAQRVIQSADFELEVPPDTDVIGG